MAEIGRDRIQIWIRRVILVMVLTTILYLGLAMASGWDAMVSALRRFPVATTLPAVLALVVLGLFLRGLRWHYFVRRMAWDVPFGPSLLAYSASYAFTVTPGKAGEVVKAGLLRDRYGISMANVAGVLLTERLGDLIAVLLLAIGGLSLMPGSGVYFVACAGIVGFLTAFVLSERLYRGILGRMGRSPKLARVSGKVLDLLGTAKDLLQPAPFFVGLGIAVVSWSLEGLAFFLILQGFGLDVALLNAFSVYGLATVIGAISLLPGGVGGFEISAGLLLKSLGFTAGQVSAPIFLLRVSTLWFTNLLGFVFLAMWFWQDRRRIRQDKVPT